MQRHEERWELTEVWCHGEPSVLLSFMSPLTLGFEGRYCNIDIDGCQELACFPGVECTDNVAPLEGATCGLCPSGYSGNGTKCLGK